MARSSSSPLGNVLLALLMAGIAWFLWARFLAVNHSIGFDPAGLGATTTGPQCTAATLPDLNLGGVVVPGYTENICLG